MAITSHLNRILFPIDFSNRCIATARRVRVIAERFDSEVFLLHVVAPLRADCAAFDLTALIPECAAALTSRARGELDGFLAAEFEHLRVRRILAEGDPADAIVQHAQALGADLIMMPTRGLGVYRRYVIGSVTAKVLHDANTPVWTGIHDRTAPPFSTTFRRILCAVDLGPHSVQVLEWASAFAGRLDASVTLLHVTADLRSIPGREFDESWHSSLVNWVRDELEKLQDSVKARCDIHVAMGDAVKGIVHTAGELKPDLLVIGRSPHEGTVGRLRAQAYAVIGQSPCPVASV